MQILDIYVDGTNGSDFNPGTSPSSPLLTIGAALAFYRGMWQVASATIHVMSAGVYSLPMDSDGTFLLFGNSSRGAADTGSYPTVRSLVIVNDAPMTDQIGTRSVTAVSGQQISISGAAIAADSLRGGRALFVTGALTGQWVDIPTNTTSGLTAWGNLAGLTNGDQLVVERPSVILQAQHSVVLNYVQLATYGVKFVSLDAAAIFEVGPFATLIVEFTEVAINLGCGGASASHASIQARGLSAGPNQGTGSFGVGTNAFLRSLYHSAVSGFFLCTNGSFSGGLITDQSAGYSAVFAGCLSTLAAYDGGKVAAEYGTTVQVGIASANYPSRIRSVGYIGAEGIYRSNLVLNNVDISNSGIAVRTSQGSMINCNGVTGTGNTTGVWLGSGGCQVNVDAGTTVTGTTEISLEGAAHTYAQLDAASPRVLYDAAYGSRVVRV